ncbi:uncharacterized protein LOC132389338 [Hypanus sabinus]|uniref:uncharacterized protein LOC132389338 n=1 Tax=Hypanus sabinus TaxID=79690 RepID=UPI0028C3947F|nr:uncharacterized protein LOC132389338 [Hypanus sabinus]
MELKLKPPTEPRIQTGDLTSTYSELKFGKPGPSVDEGSPVSSGGGDWPVSARTGPQTEEPEKKVGRRLSPKISLGCLVMFVFIATVAGLTVYVFQTHHSLISCERNYLSRLEQRQEENRTQLQVQELNATQIACLKNLSAANSNLSVSARMHRDLGQQFRELEKKYRSVNETKARICELLTSRRELKCCEGWIYTNGACYFISKVAKSQDEAKDECSKNGSKLLEFSSEENFLFNALNGSGYYWVENCGDSLPAGNNVVHKTGKGECKSCPSDLPGVDCPGENYFICKTSAISVIPRKAWELCQKSPGPI